jgi:hypothetical protein
MDDMQVILCSKFLDAHTIVSGTQDGSLYVWNTLGVLIHIIPGIKAHGPAAEVLDLCVRPPDGAMPVFYLVSAGYTPASL